MPATILLVDSDLIDRADWQALLQFHGYKVHAVPNGKSALACFPVVKPDLVLMDATLADIPSDEVCRRLKAEPRIGDTPIVVVGSYLSRMRTSHRREEQPGDSSGNPATRAQALDRINSILAQGGQFDLFGETPANPFDTPEFRHRALSSLRFDG